MICHAKDCRETICRGDGCNGRPSPDLNKAEKEFYCVEHYLAVKVQMENRMSGLSASSEGSHEGKRVSK